MKDERERGWEGGRETERGMIKRNKTDKQNERRREKKKKQRREA